MNKQQHRKLVQAGRKPMVGQTNVSLNKATAVSASEPEPQVVSVDGSNIAPQSADELLKRAKQTIDSAIHSLRPAAEDIAAAQKLGATQREIAAAVGMSLGWVNALLKWRRNGYQDRTPFGTQAKLGRENVQSLNKSEAHTEVDVTSSNLAASAVAVTASAEPSSPHLDEAPASACPDEGLFTDADRERLVKTLSLLGSDQAGERESAALAAERLRHGIKLTWDQLIIAARKPSDVEDLLAQAII